MSDDTKVFVPDSASFIPIPRIAVIIPAFNEEQAIGDVLAHIPSNLVTHVIVADNNSTDSTAEVARLFGADVVTEKEQGYGAACLRGIARVANLQPTPDIVVFIDGDYSDHPEEMARLVEPIITGRADMVIGSRALGKRAGMMETGALLPQAAFGNWLATRLLHRLWRVRFTDLGPFRAITWTALQRLQMCDRNFGWTVEMQIKAALYKLRCEEVPVSYRKRVGISKITGTLRGTIQAGVKILWTIGKYWLWSKREQKR
jgi:glycosyltransferase involved in cell wall biosynthesis